MFLTHKGDKVGNFPTQSLQIYLTGWVEKKLTNNHNRYYRYYFAYSWELRVICALQMCMEFGIKEFLYLALWVIGTRRRIPERLKVKQEIVDVMGLS